jgi:hypothetical protein
MRPRLICATFILLLGIPTLQVTGKAIIGTPGVGVPVFVESVGATTNGSTSAISVSLGTNTTSANEDVGVGVYTQISSSTGCSTGTSMVTDSDSQTYTFIVGRYMAESGGGCLELWHYKGSASGVTTIDVTLGNSVHEGGAIVWHVKNITTGNDPTATIWVPAAPGDTTPWTGATVSTNGSTEFMAALTYSVFHTNNSGALNALLFTNTGNGAWTQGETICSQSSSSPCTVEGANLDGANAGVFGFAYLIGSSTSFANTGSNNGSTNVYYNFPGIAGFK